MTERLYFTDSRLLRFSALVLDSGSDNLHAVLDRTAFYPTSGGQPHDLGTLNGIPVLEVLEDDNEQIVHTLAAPLAPGATVEGIIDPARRFDHMQQHSGQHLLSAVFEELFQARTVSFHLGAESSTIDLEIAALSPDQLRAAELRANTLVFENRPLRVDFEDAATVQGLRKETGRTGILRVVSIDACDRSACGGTHVAHTGEIGPILLRKLDKIRATVRVEFLCGHRATARARADYDALSQISRLFSSALDDTPAAVSAQQERLRDLEKEKRKLSLDLAALRGRDLYSSATPSPDGLRRHLERLPAPPADDARALAQSFCAQPAALFAASCDNPPTILLAASADSGLHAGNVLKQALTAAGGRGGGNAALAQGTLPDAQALAALLSQLGF